MSDKFVDRSSELDSPGFEHYDITPSDTVDELLSFRSVWVGVAGDVVLVSNNGTAKTYKGASAGSIIPMRGKRVNDTGTDASYMIGIL